MAATNADGIPRYTRAVGDEAPRPWFQRPRPHSMDLVRWPALHPIAGTGDGEQSREMPGLVHTHPQSTPAPSSADLRLAGAAPSIWVIAGGVSLAGSRGDSGSAPAQRGAAVASRSPRAVPMRCDGNGRRIGPGRESARSSRSAIGHQKVGSDRQTPIASGTVLCRILPSISTCSSIEFEQVSGRLSLRLGARLGSRGGAHTPVLKLSACGGEADAGGYTAWNASEM